MQAVTYQGKNSIAVVDLPVPRPAAGQARIRVTYAGICGTDLAIAAGKHPRARPPLVMGHELAGVVDDLPPGAPSGLRPGDRVAVFPLLSCGQCYVCQMGLPHVCRHLRLIGIDVDGGFAGYLVAGQDALVKIPDALSDREAALLEPLAVCVHAVRMSRLRVGDTALVTGAGPIGVLTALTARAAGASTVIITEVSPPRLDAARRLGLTALDASDPALVSRVRDMTGGRGADVLFEAAGHPGVAPLLLELVRIRGQIVQVGIFKEPVPLDLRTLNFHEVSLIGARVYTRQDFTQAVQMAAARQVNLTTIPIATFPLSGAAQAFETARRAEVLKVLFEVNPV